MAKKDHSSLLTVHERKGSNTVKRKQGFRKYDGNIDVTNFRRQRTTAVNIKENAKLAVCMTILFLLCLICAVLEINSPEFSYQSWLALFGILSMLLALIMEYPVCQSFLALTAYTLIFQLSTNEVVVSGIGSPSILAVGLFQPFLPGHRRLRSYRIHSEPGSRKKPICVRQLSSNGPCSFGNVVNAIQHSAGTDRHANGHKLDKKFGVPGERSSSLPQLFFSVRRYAYPVRHEH